MLKAIGIDIKSLHFNNVILRAITIIVVHIYSQAFLNWCYQAYKVEHYRYKKYIMLQIQIHVTSFSICNCFVAIRCQRIYSWSRLKQYPQFDEWNIWNIHYAEVVPINFKQALEMPQVLDTLFFLHTIPVRIDVADAFLLVFLIRSHGHDKFIIEAAWQITILLTLLIL